MKKVERKVSGNFGWAGHGDSFGSAPPFSMHVGFICNDKEAPKTASVWNQAESESKEQTSRCRNHIKVDAHIPLWISLHSIPSDQLFSTSNLQFCVPLSSVCISLIPQRDLHTTAPCSQVVFVPLRDDFSSCRQQRRKYMKYINI